MKLPDELGYYEHGITIELQINEFVILPISFIDMANQYQTYN